ncbi:MAG: CoA transferase [Desulfarculaceae bacterium]|nr:CoA transferase [Desulfarculaceae bacterium]MCF8073149.1 CoA transferase [Desulfarculaceae bacterium]MCF8101766.1 CoA transferase [Desulfarculaceae bacterium]MCF8118396.1 CoA transferase [Desulfarculaceae bacterium]
MNEVLSGIRVLDFGRHISGPMASLMLADFGAEVIRIDRPGGDEDRFMGLPSKNNDSYAFMNFSRNKKGITLDFMHSKEGFEILMKLIAKSDVLVHNYSPMAVKKLGIDYETVSALNPRLIYVEITGFGSDGPYDRRLGFDQIAQAMSGAMHITGQPDMPPQRAEVRYSDFGTGFFGAYGVALALLEREKTGKGQKIEANLLRTAVFMNASPVTEYRATGKVRGRIGNRSWYAGTSDLFKTKDQKWVYISTVTRHLYERSMELFGRTDLLERPDIKTDYDRFVHRQELDKVMADWVARHDSGELAEKFEAARLPYGFVYDATQVDVDPAVVHDKMLVKKTNYDGEEVTLSDVPLHLKDNPGSVKMAAPVVGEHNQDIYKNVLGMSDQELADLEERKII